MSNWQQQQSSSYITLQSHLVFFSSSIFLHFYSSLFYLTILPEIYESSKVLIIISSYIVFFNLFFIFIRNKIQIDFKEVEEDDEERIKKEKRNVEISKDKDYGSPFIVFQIVLGFEFIQNYLVHVNIRRNILIISFLVCLCVTTC